MNNNQKTQETISKAINAYAAKYGKTAEQPHEAYCKLAGDQVILASTNNQLAIFNLKDGKFDAPIGGFKK